MTDVMYSGNRLCSGQMEIFIRNLTAGNSTSNETDTGQVRRTSGTTGTGISVAGWIQVFLPAICCLGIAGNVLNIVVLTKKRRCHSLRKLEKSVNLGLTALAVSDLLFNAAVFPFCFTPPIAQGDTISTSELPWIYYRVYGVSTINLFLMTSTWLIVLLAVERYIVLYDPLRAKWFSCVNKAKLLILAVYFCTCTLTLPYFLHVHVLPCQMLDGSTTHEVMPRWDVHTTAGILTVTYIRWIWPTLAVFMPLPLLVFCNIRLIQGLKRMPQHRRNNSRASSSSSTCSRSSQGQKVKGTRITLTLVIVVFVALALVTPAEVLKFVNPYRLWGDVGYVLASVANLLQAINFAFNFVLYCTLDVTFRKICRNLVKVNCSIAPKGDSQINIIKKGATATSLKGSTRVRWKLLENKRVMV